MRMHGERALVLRDPVVRIHRHGHSVLSLLAWMQDLDQPKISCSGCTISEFVILCEIVISRVKEIL